MPIGKSHKLTGRQRAFVEAFVSNGGHRTKAAIAAGYSMRHARMQAYDLMKLPHVLSAVVECCLLRLGTTAPVALHRMIGLTEAKSEYVALKACQVILNRAGLEASARPGKWAAGSVTVQIDLS